jgi:hypothetical protein
VYLLLVAIAISLASWIIDAAEGVPLETTVIGVMVVGNAVVLTQVAKAEEAVAAFEEPPDFFPRTHFYLGLNRSLPGGVFWFPRQRFSRRHNF